MLKRKSLSLTMILSFFLSIFIPLAILGAALTIYFRNSMSHESERLFTNTFYAISGNITASIEDLQKFSITPYFYKEIMDDLKNFNSPAFYSNQVIQFDTVYNYTTTLKKLLNVSRDNITGVTFFPEKNEKGDAYLLSRTGNLETVGAKLQDQPWYAEVAAINGSAYITVNTKTADREDLPESMYSVIRIIKNTETRRDIGALKVDASGASISGIFKNIIISEHSYFLLLDEKNNIIYSTGDPPAGIIDRIPENGKRFGMGADSYLTYSGAVSQTKWRLVYLSSENDINSTTRPIIYLAAVLGIACLILSVFIFAVNNAKTLARVRQIIDAMGRIEKGDFTVKLTLNRKENYELAMIIESLNQMAKRLTEQLEKEHKMEISQKNAEYRALQTQINPHFFYNTLNGFITLNRLGRKQILEDSIIDLTRLFRYTCSGGDLSTVESEFKFVEQYLNLQQLRFIDRISFSIQYEDIVAGFVIPKLLLQPLVENSIIHGMEPYDGEIRIGLYAFSQNIAGIGVYLFILVLDSGHGFDVKTVDKINSVGLNSVIDRIELYNKNAYFQIFSAEGKGARCILAIPVKE